MSQAARFSAEPAEVHIIGRMRDEWRPLDITDYPQFRDAMIRCRAGVSDVEPPPRVSVPDRELDQHFTFEKAHVFDKLGLSREELAAAGALSAEELEAAIIADFEEQERLRAVAVRNETPDGRSEV